jgi:hypothetical protein
MVISSGLEVELTARGFHRSVGEAGLGGTPEATPGAERHTGRHYGYFVELLRVYLISTLFHSDTLPKLR